MSEALTVTVSVSEEIFAKLPEYVNAVDVSPDGRRVVACSVSGHICISERDKNVHVFKAHDGDVVRVKWSPSGQFVASCGIDGALRIWNSAGVLVTESQHKGWSTDLAWRPNSDEVAAGIGRRVVRLLADQSDSIKHADLKATVECVAWSNDSRHLFAGHYGGIAVFQGASSPVKYFPWKGAPLTVAASPDGRWVVSGNQDASLHVWRFSNGSELQMTGFPTKVLLIAWHPQSLRLANASMNEISEWDFSGKGPKGSTPIGMLGHSSRVVGLDYAPTDPNMLGSVATDGSACLWRPVKKGNSLILAHKTRHVFSSMKWSPTALQLICGTSSGEVVSLSFNEQAED